MLLEIVGVVRRKMNEENCVVQEWMYNVRV